MEAPMNKIFSILLVLVAVLLLQGCATSRPNLLCSKGCHSGDSGADEFWSGYGQQYNTIRKNGQRLAADGETVLSPVKGQKGVYQDENGYRVVHQLDCQKEGLGSNLLWGVVVPLASAAIQNPLGQGLAYRVGPVVQQQGQTKRYYKCADVAEALAGGNAVFYQHKLAEVASSTQTQVPAVKEREVARSQTLASQSHEEECAEHWGQCSVGKEWGPKGILSDGSRVCGCQ